MNRTDTEVTEESALLSPRRRARPGAGRAGDALERRRQPARRAGRPARPAALLRVVGRSPRRTLGRAAPTRRSSAARFILDLEASVALAPDVTLAVGGQNVFNTFSDRMDLFAARFGLPYSQFTPWGLSGGYYYARLNYGWGG